jgi:hypothetical protein
MFGLTPELVTVVGIAVTLLQTLLLAIAGFVAYFQVRETARTRYLAALVRMFDDFGSREAYQYADAVLGLPQRVEDYTAEEMELATWEVRVYEKIAFLVESGMIPAEYLIPLYSRRIVWSWQALQPYIMEQRRLRDTGGAYRLAGDAHNFEKLAKRARAYRARTYPAKRVDPPIPGDYRRQVAAAVAQGRPLIPARAE